MRVWIYILIWIVIIVAAAYGLAMIFAQRIKFSAKPKTITLPTGSGLSNLQTEFIISVENENGFEISADDIYIDLYYGGKLIANSVTDTVDIKILKKQTTTFDYTMNIYTIPELFEFIQGMQSGTPMEIRYKVKLKVWGIPFTIRNKFKT